MCSIITVTLIAFAISNVLLLIYPLTFARKQMKQSVRKTQYCFLIVTVLMTILMCIVTEENMTHMVIELDLTSIVVIVSGLIICLGVLLIMSSLLLMRINDNDIKCLENLQQLLEQALFSTENMRQQLGDYAKKHNYVLSDYGIDLMLNLFIKQYSEMNRPPLDSGQFLLRMCLETTYAAKQFVPIPFPHINIIFSLSGVGVVIALLTTLIP